ncbi:MAG: bifunctional folylpolyglutamate synthase/dihydrofolate synthase [Deltaproteobacteria bacterium]|nr:bifunctional folylpolyglutamate synthase/dihydrofolate synthase [Deltaproteobacteria bacterium]MCB9786356.1 bifunctional folylpolyglutamate synthase/dihydrofolate synthase [Deltaproteobacteria bacterium]
MTNALPEAAWTADQAHAWLASLAPRGIQLGLDRVETALARLGSPHLELPAVTIAGTNGKGSTAAFLASIGHAAGYRVGLYTSPHLVSVTERIRVGGTPILPVELASWARRVRDVIEGRDGGEPVPLTYFEALTVMALGYFVEREVDLAVLEVGMGGRLDATAVVPPKVAVITPIGLDHQAFLGDTLEAICAEKAGILREGATLVTNVDRRLFRSVVGPRAFDLRAPIRRAGVDFQYRWLHEGFRYRGWLHRLGPVRLGLAGRFQAQNAALACAAAESLQAHGFRFRAAHMAEGLHRARHPGRLERREPLRGMPKGDWPAMVLDGSHNPMGAAVLARELVRALPERPRVLLFSARHDKDAAGILAPLARHLDALVVTTLTDQPPPPLGPLAALARRHGVHLEIEPHIPSALRESVRLATPSGGVLVAGSLYLLGEVMPLLPPPERPA